MYVGFLFGDADNLPHSDNINQECEKILQSLSSYQQYDGYCQILRRLSASSGQTFLATIDTVIKKMTNQDVALQLFNAIQQYFNAEQSLVQDLPRTIEDISEKSLQQLQELKVGTEITPDIEAYLQALLQLAQISEQILNPVFAQTDAIGSVMRKRLQHITEFIVQNTSILQGVR